MTGARTATSDASSVHPSHDTNAPSVSQRPSARQCQVLIISAVTTLGILGYTIFAVLLLLKWRSFEEDGHAVNPNSTIPTGQDVGLSWAAVFSPLWSRDLLAASFWAYNVVYVRGSQMATKHFYVVATISIVSVLMAACFKVLLVHRLLTEEGSIRLVCLPLYVSCAVQFLLHWMKQVDQHGRRPGNAIELQNLIAVTVACKLDGVLDQGKMPWSTSLWPLWFALGGMAVFLMTTACILPTLCCLDVPRHTVAFATTSFTMMLVMMACTILAAVRMVWWLDGYHAFTADEICGPMILTCVVAVLLVLTSTVFAYRFVRGTAATPENPELTQDMLNLINSAVKPTHLIRMSDTLYRRAAEQASEEAKPKDVEMSAAEDLESGAGDATEDLERAEDLESGAGDATLLSGDSDTTAAEDTSPPSPSEDVCYICVERPPNAVFLECGHGGVCYTCAMQCFEKQHQRQSHGCPMCRQLIIQVVKLGSEDHINGKVLVRVE